MAFGGSRIEGRVVAGLGAVALEALFVAALLWGLGVRVPLGENSALEVFDVMPPPPPPPVERVVPKPATSHRPEGAAAPPNLRSKATEIVAVPPVVPLVVPPPVIAAPVAGVGSDATAGAADVVGPGTGSGGIGNGTGSGGAGDGDGNGGDETPPRWRRGRIKDSDYPHAAEEVGAGGTVRVRYTVETNGRVTGCRITQSSGNRELDATTCRLIEQRFRYDPSRDAAGRPVRSIIVADHSWIMEVRDED